uniref:HEPN family nuclease n=4 Tax=Enterobacterales TaxID=91347 RepID=UPI001D0F165D|nr:HEPN family nuclease [Klebsiella pneumoniae]UCK62507.1 hypothetical protein LFOJIBMD_00031 [Klebsiella pneumoniae]UCK65066.1 hypothetical protein KCOLMDFC_00115 [Klebsiella pneumoniae]
MGNYSDFETDFVQRTLALIDQYNEMIEELGKPFSEQYNYTLTLNCLLGLIVLPKERALSFLPADRLTRQLKAEMGLHESQLPGPEMNLRQLIHKMRNSVAHFCVQVESVSDAHLVDWIVFRESQGDGDVYASFSAPELLPFLKYYATLLLESHCGIVTVICLHVERVSAHETITLINASIILKKEEYELKIFF